MRTGELAIIKLHVNHRRAVETDFRLNHAVLRWNLETVHGRMRLHLGLSVGRGDILIPRLGPFERTVFKSESVHHPVPAFVMLRTLEIIGEQKLFFHRDRLLGKRWLFRKIQRVGGNCEARGDEEDCG